MRLMWDALVCLILHQFVNGSSLLLRSLTLWPHIDEYLLHHFKHLEVLELLDWDALKAVHEALGLAPETMERLEGEHIPIGCVP